MCKATKVLTEQHGYRVIWHGIKQITLHQRKADAHKELRHLRALRNQRTTRRMQQDAIRKMVIDGEDVWIH